MDGLAAFGGVFVDRLVHFRPRLGQLAVTLVGRLCVTAITGTRCQVAWFYRVGPGILCQLVSILAVAGRGDTPA